MKIVDMVGNVYGKLTVLEFSGSDRGKRYYRCQCSCGTVKIIDGSSMRQGKTVSCGCQFVERMRILNQKRWGTREQICGSPPL